ncbi:MAG: hypothetical protein HUU15_18020 [Candidatus Brocadiae bacterium]|nr:hypothetical protein [Candidatus Brocadiia bacterium]
MKRILAAVMVTAAVAWGDAAPTTRPVAAQEVQPTAPGESAPVMLEAEGYKVALSWYPANPKPGDLVRFLAVVTVPGGEAPTIVVRATLARTGPGGAVVLIDKKEVPSEVVPSDGRYVLSHVFHTEGVYRLDLGIDDLSMARSISVGQDLTVGSPKSGGLVYGIAIGGVALIAVVLAFGMRRPAAE